MTTTHPLFVARTAGVVAASVTSIGWESSLLAVYVVARGDD